MKTQPISLEYQQKTWESAIESEALWWKSRFSIYRALWEFRGKQRENNSKEGAYYVLPELAAVPVGGAILDVGCGPITAVSTVNCPHSITLEGCDPLAPIYSALLESIHITPVLQTRQAFLECLDDNYAENSFDFVTARNCMDHAIDPLAGIFQLLHVAKIGGTVRMAHHEKEGSHNNFHGLHKWDFFEQDSELFLQRQNAIAVNISKMIQPFATISLYRQPHNNGRQTIVAVLKKTASPPLVRKNAFSFSMLSSCIASQKAKLAASGALEPYKVKVLLFGCETIALRIKPFFDPWHTLVMACIDLRTEMQGKMFPGGSPIIALEQAGDYDVDAVLVAQCDIDAALPKLQALGIPQEKILWIDFVSIAWKRIGPEASSTERLDAIRRYISEHPLLGRIIETDKLLKAAWLETSL